MRKIILFLTLALAAAASFACVHAAAAHADYFAYPCNYPFQGVGGSVSFVVTAGGQYCDGPTEVNWSHYHCESGGAHLPLSGIGLASPVPGVSLGALGSGGAGGDLEGCHFLCPDGSLAPFPNPPAAWIRKLVLKPEDNDCRDHMRPRGDTDHPLDSQLPPGTPPAGPPPPDGPAGQPPIPAPPAGQPNVTPQEEPSLLTPGSPMPLP